MSNKEYRTGIYLTDMPGAKYRPWVERRAEFVARAFSGQNGVWLDSQKDFRDVQQVLLSSPLIGVKPDVDIHGGIIPDEEFASKVLFYADLNGRGSRFDRVSRRLQAEGLTLPGFSCFSEMEVREAINRLGTDQSRLIHPRGTDSAGQAQYDPKIDMRVQLGSILGSSSLESGLVVCKQLENVRAVSFGEEDFLGRRLSQIATQEQTVNSERLVAFGGCEAQMFNGGLDTIRESEIGLNGGFDFGRGLDVALRAIGILRECDVAGRIVLDVLQGYDAQGNLYMGVTDYSGRVSGTSPVMAMAASRLLSGERTMFGIVGLQYPKNEGGFTKIEREKMHAAARKRGDQVVVDDVGLFLRAGLVGGVHI